MKDSKKVESKRHTPEPDHKSLHEAVNRASKDASFISKVVAQLDTLKFPAYKHQILNFIQNKFSDNDDLGLLKSLNDTVLFRSKYDVKQGLEQENSNSKQQPKSQKLPGNIWRYNIPTKLKNAKTTLKHLQLQ